MKKALYTLFILAIAISTPAFSQTLTQTIRGTILDADSKSPLPEASIFLFTSDTILMTATSNADGKFRLEKVPVGRRSLKVVYVGYDDAVINNIIVTSGKEVVLNIELHEKVITSDEVVITPDKDKTKANNDLVTNSSRNFNSEETERYAGSRGDPSKMVANYAGVATGNDANNSIIVRGNSPLGVLWRLEGVDIPNPNHFSTQGATGGPVSILNNNLLGASDFLTGAFPSEYGNKYAAVFDLRLRNGNNEKYEYLAQIGFNGAEFGVEGPLFKKNGGSFLLNYRYSTLELFQLAGISFGVSAIPHYTDLCYKFNLPTQKAGVFSLWGIGGASHIDLLDSQKDSTDWSFTSKGEDLRFYSRMGATGFSHVYFYNPNVSQRISLSANGTFFKITLDTLSSTRVPYRQYDNTSIDKALVGAYSLSWKLNAHHLLKFGANYEQKYFDYHSRYWSTDYNIYVDELKANNNTGILQGYVHWQYRATEDLTFNSGLHYQVFMLNNTQALEPRAGMRWAFAKKHSLSFAFGMHSQTQPLIYYFYREYDPATGLSVNTNRSLGLTKSIHYVGGYDVSFSKDIRMKIEGYYQNLYNIPVSKYYSNSFSLINAGNDLDGIQLVDSLTNKGTGYNYGTEITLEKFFSKGYYFLTDLSLYRSKYKGSDGVLHNTAFAGGYVYNTLGGVEIPLGKKNKILGLDLKVTFAGGNRYTPIDEYQSALLGHAVSIDSLAFSKQFRNYQKVDFKISFKINSKRCTQSIFIHIENILNHKNILQQTWDTSTNSIKYDYQLGLFPYAGYRVEF
ncbi:MAG TPA: TonB-dependent receptor [Bacteroidia bacterium]